VSARHKKKRILFTHNRKLSKISVATAGVAVAVPAAVFAGIATSGASAGDSASLLAMAGSQPGARPAAAHLDRGEPLTGVARREVASLGATRVRAQRAAERTADRRAARRAAAHAAAQAAAAATPAPSPSSRAATGSAPSPSGNPQKIAEAMLGSYGWSSSQFGCLVSLWNLESGWNVYASNPSSGAYGIPQALPGSKMASAGADWQSNPATQIRWGLGYIKSLYGSPCGAWSHEQADGWY
jgi:hypothetical protein